MVSALPQLEIKICYEGDELSVYGTQVQGFLRLAAGGWWLIERVAQWSQSIRTA